jgi:hypothetical protein
MGRSPNSVSLLSSEKLDRNATETQHLTQIGLILHYRTAELLNPDPASLLEGER